MNSSDMMFIIPLSYSEREKEIFFLKDLLNKFDKDSLIGCNVFVSNNIYNLEVILALNFENEIEEFKFWIKERYSSKANIMQLKYCFSDYFFHIQNKGYNAFSLTDAKSVDVFFTDIGNDMFLFHSKQVMNKILPPIDDYLRNATIFLSHSSLDKDKVDSVYNYLNSKDIRAWYDKYEIDFGESVTDKINKGLDNSNLGLIFLSKNFLKAESGWTLNEMNFFFSRRMRDTQKKFIVINLDLKQSELPPLLQDYKYMDFNSISFYQDLYNTLKRLDF